ncbi:aliphatic sulfonate ABC transporter substrate-binding protein [Clostridium manihotivorum]|uniref:Sulfate ABC transporter substrate-binding protein n=1 Tax=Clostridium manihotivorum TaxID=2320868 RepID=A0A410DND8_9CLOT|nr:aliphatic sulfonate ABC transporter substrate-binding protein [Clostridium manihotivorum]QAA30566.1 sulfate ABC transporter substrate-binding protein [Clostridium manihotivorum]
MNIKRILASIVTSVMVLGLVGCSPKSKDTSKVTIGFFSNITHAQALLGMNNGQFKRDIGSEYNLSFKQFNAGPDELQALLAGSIDIGYIGPGPALNGYINSKGAIQIIAGASSAGAVLLTSKDSSIKTVKDLSGKKVAIPQFGNTQDLSLRALLKENGLKDKTSGGTVDIVQAENSLIKTLLSQHKIDAALVPEPWGARLEQEAGAKVVLDYKDVWRDGNYSVAVVVVRKEFMAKHPEVVERFLKAHVSLTDYINSNPKEAKKAINDEIKKLTKKPLKGEVLDKAFKRLEVTNYPIKDSIVEMAELSRSIGFIREEPELDDLYSLDMLDKAVNEAGKGKTK